MENLDMTPEDAVRPAVPPTITFIDSASLYEVVAIFEGGKRDSLYPWAWRTAIILTHALIHIELLRMAPAPNAVTTASGLYKSVSEAVTDAQIVQQTTSAGNDSAALLETVDWAAQNTDFLREECTRLFADTKNFEPWLHRSIRHAWVEHATRLDGLFNAEFSEPIAMALNTTKADIDGLRLKSVNADHIAALAKKMPNTTEFDVMRRAYVVSAVIRGYYHQVIARNRGEHLFRHPFRRNGPLPHSLNEAAKQEVVQYRYPITSAQSAFATIVLASVMRTWRSNHRPKQWIETIHSVRRAVRARDGSLASTNLYALSWPHAGQDAAVQAARTLGIACPSTVLNMMVDVAGAAGLGSVTALALTACPPAALAVATVAGNGVGGLIQPSKIFFGGRLERLAKRAPGAIDYVWDEPAK